MKLLVVHPSTELYGSDRQLLESVNAFAGADADVTVVLPGAGSLATRLEHVSVVTARFPVLRKAQLRSHRLLWLLIMTPFVVLRLARMISAARPDAVYVNTVTLPHWVLAARLARRPVVVHVHEAEEMSSSLVRRALYAPLVVAHRVIANSETTARVVTQAWNRTRIRVVPNGVPDAGPCPADSAVAGRLVLVSRLSPRKGIDVALEAVARLGALGHDVTLTLCGSAFSGYEWFERQLRERAARPDLAGKVTFAGFVDPVREELGQAQVVLIPSFGESFGNAAVEGMLAGRAVVASDVQGLAEIISDGQTGLLVPAGDAAELADAVARLLDDAVLRADLARRGRDSAARRFGISLYRDEIVTAASDVIASAGGRSGARRLVATIAALAAVAVSLGACSASDGSSHSAEPVASTSATSSNAVSSNAVSSNAASSGSGGAVAPSPSTAASSGSDAIDRTVASGSVVTLPAVALTKAAAFGDGVRVRLTGHAVVAGKATRPGEVAGPAVRLTLSVTNSSRKSIPLNDAVVTVTDARQVPLSVLAAQTTPLRGSLAVGRSAAGSYVFVLSMGRHNPYTIRVSHSGQSAVVQFVGDAA